MTDEKKFFKQNEFA